MDMKKWAQENTIHRIVAGSNLYGTARPDSDLDYRGVCLMPPEALIGLQNFDQYQRHDKEVDETIYGISKFFTLSLGANPNIMDILCAPIDRWLVHTDAWATVYNNRHMFFSQKVRHTFSGYAYSQLKRLQRHYSWLQKLKSGKMHMPTLEEYCGRLESTEKGGQVKVFKHQEYEQQYEKAMREWKQYSTWLRERNPARAKLEEKYGYDTKHAAHLVRLLVKAEAFLSSGIYNPILSPIEKETVLGVMNGDWSYEFLIGWAEYREEKVKSMDSGLPYKPDQKMAEDILMRINYDTVQKAKQMLGRG